MKEYALYKGEEILCIGTAKEIAKKLDVLPETIMFYGTNTYKRRLAKRKNVRNARILVILGEEDCEE
ncbi:MULTISPECIES: hypothetical protein [unclassified Clostridium]|uniref:hypothetical protein n=1 Tax=unclassified Clostridium TaxID=2614128 RepID=UPI0025C395F9|nr:MULTISPECIES: hypothetical protein [unclassified Clostridium]